MFSRPWQRCVPFSWPRECASTARTLLIGSGAARACGRRTRTTLTFCDGAQRDLGCRFIGKKLDGTLCVSGGCARAIVSKSLVTKRSFTSGREPPILGVDQQDRRALQRSRNAPRWLPIRAQLQFDVRQFRIRTQHWVAATTALVR